MRKCVRCGAEMQEGFSFSGGYGNVLRKKASAWKPCIQKRRYAPNAARYRFISTKKVLKSWQNNLRGKHDNKRKIKDGTLFARRLLFDCFT